MSILLKVPVVSGIFAKYKGYKSSKGFCNICGKKKTFFVNDLVDANDNFNKKETFVCCHCGSVLRNRIVIAALMDVLKSENIRDIKEKIYLASHNGPVFEFLSKRVSSIICSEYFDDTPRGKTNSRGILCEDLTALTFDDESLDVVITEAVMEHVNNPKSAFKEIFRVLKPGGYSINHFPLDSQHTTTRIDENGKQLLPLLTHSDPLRAEGVPVFTDFGYDDVLYFIANAVYPCKVEFSTYDVNLNKSSLSGENTIVIVAKKL